MFHANGLTAETPEWWVMLVFDNVANMARFVNELHAKLGDFDSDEIRVGINAINIKKSLFAKISTELGDHEFKYTLETL